MEPWKLNNLLVHRLFGHESRITRSKRSEQNTTAEGALAPRRGNPGTG
jgi:hypothetical protein